MSQAWLKPFGDRTHNIKDDWTTEFLEPDARLHLMTGSENPGARPKLEPGDEIVLHAVGHRRVIGAGVVLTPPAKRKDTDSKWSLKQWPWTYDCRMEIWVPFVHQGPSTWELVSRVKGHISHGAPYSLLRPAERNLLIQALDQTFAAVRRPGSVTEAARTARVEKIRKSGRRLSIPELDAGLRSSTSHSNGPRRLKLR